MRKVEVVGADGSQAVMAAVRWAAEGAALHRVPLRLVPKPDDQVGQLPGAKVGCGARSVEARLEVSGVGRRQ